MLTVQSLFVSESHNNYQFYPVLAFCDTVNIDRKRHIDAFGASASDWSRMFLITSIYFALCCTILQICVCLGKRFLNILFSYSCRFENNDQLLPFKVFFFRPDTCSFQWFLCPPRLDPNKFWHYFEILPTESCSELKTNGASFTTSITTFPLICFQFLFWFCFLCHQNTLLWTSVYWNANSSDLYKTKSTFSQSWLQI